MNVLTNAIVFDGRLRSASKGVAAAAVSGSGNGGSRTKRDEPTGTGGQWYTGI